MPCARLLVCAECHATEDSNPRPVPPLGETHINMYTEGHVSHLILEATS